MQIIVFLPNNILHLNEFLSDYLENDSIRLGRCMFAWFEFIFICLHKNVDILVKLSVCKNC